MLFLGSLGGNKEGARKPASGSSRGKTYSDLSSHDTSLPQADASPLSTTNGPPVFPLEVSPEEKPLERLRIFGRPLSLLLVEPENLPHADTDDLPPALHPAWLDGKAIETFMRPFLDNGTSRIAPVSEKALEDLIVDFPSRRLLPDTVLAYTNLESADRQLTVLDFCDLLWAEIQVKHEKGQWDGQWPCIMVYSDNPEIRHHPKVEPLRRRGILHGVWHNGHFSSREFVQTLLTSLPHPREGLRDAFGHGFRLR